MADLIRRPVYLEKIKPYIGVHIIKVLTGQRRVGKSYILKDTENYIAEIKPDANCIYLNTETGDGKSVRTAEDLYSFIQAKLKTDKENFVFIDEIQEIKNFEAAVRSLFADQSCDIYCTGSNAHLLSGELATYLAGRYIQIRIHPLSYQEFMKFYNRENTMETCLFFLQRGGMPFLYSLPPEESFAFEYLRNVSESILFRDVIAREKIRNVHFLESLVSYIADNTGSLFSASNISKYLKNQKISMNVQTVITYLHALEQSFIINAVPRKDIHGMKIFEIGEKYYFEDTGLRNVTAGNSFYDDSAKILENAVYNYLTQKEFEVYIGQSGTQEIDFAAQKQQSKLYVQVSQTIADRQTFERETGALLKIQDNFPKYVVTLDPMISDSAPNGIHIMNVKDFFVMNW